MKGDWWAILLGVVFAAAGGCDRTSASHASGSPVQQAVGSGPVSLRLTLSRDHLTTADDVRLTLEATAGAGANAVLPEPPADIGGFTLAERRRAAPRLSADGGLTTSETWVLDPFLPGDYTIPALEVRCTDKDGAVTTIRTNPVTVAVASVLPQDQQDTAEIGPAREVVDPEPPPQSNRAIWAAGAAALAVFVVVGAGILWTIRRRHELTPDPYLAAERRIREIQGEAIGDPAAAITEASTLVRSCLADRLEPMAATRTTDELLASPSLAFNLSEVDMGALRASLHASDAVKFAGAPVSEEQARALMAESLGLVRSLATMVVIRTITSPVGSEESRNPEGAAP